MSDAEPSRLSEAPPTEALQALVGTVIAERYQVEALLGSGGMGAVYRAKHLHMQKVVALKILHRSMASVSEVVKRFEREAVAAARVEHPNVTKATDFGLLPDGTFYLIMEYVDGVNLRNVLDSGPLPLPRVAKIARQVASALAAAHALGIVHRDLKPDNVMLVDRPNDPDFVKVLDMGIAKLPAETASAGAALTRVGTVLGTPQYMAPEQAAGNAVDHRADLYALGVIIYEMLTGQPPFSGNDVMSVLVKQLTEPTPKLPASVPADWSTLVMHLLEKEPDARLQTASEACSRLNALDDSEPVDSPPEASVAALTVETQAVKGSFIEQLARRRHALFAVLGISVAAVAVALFGGSNQNDKPATPLTQESAMPLVAPAARSAPEIKPQETKARPPTLPAVTPKVDNQAVDSGAPEIKPTGGNAGGTRATSTQSTAKKTTPKRKAEKRRTGPGGIYIPPPSQWFN
jgi:serine/threonine-protein kinase